MAKFLLIIFGGGSILFGLIIILFGLVTAPNGAIFTAALYFGSGLLLFGAPLLGFARVIDLLEDIASNTRPVRPISIASDPRAGNHSTAGVSERKSYAGRFYYLHGDGVVVSNIGETPHTWRNESEFLTWSNKNSETASQPSTSST